MEVKASKKSGIPLEKCEAPLNIKAILYMEKVGLEETENKALTKDNLKKLDRAHFDIKEKDEENSKLLLTIKSLQIKVEARKVDEDRNAQKLSAANSKNLKLDKTNSTLVSKLALLESELAILNRSELKSSKSLKCSEIAVQDLKSKEFGILFELNAFKVKNVDLVETLESTLNIVKHQTTELNELKAIQKELNGWK